jgi:hypothetical protein
MMQQYNYLPGLVFRHDLASSIQVFSEACKRVLANDRNLNLLIISNLLFESPQFASECF